MFSCFYVKVISPCLHVPYKFCNPVKLNSRCLLPLTVCKQLMLSQSDIGFYRKDRGIVSCFHVFTLRALGPVIKVYFHVFMPNLSYLAFMCLV